MLSFEKAIDSKRRGVLSWQRLFSLLQKEAFLIHLKHMVLILVHVLALNVKPDSEHNAWLVDIRMLYSNKVIVLMKIFSQPFNHARRFCHALFVADLENSCDW